MPTVRRNIIDNANYLENKVSEKISHISQNRRNLHSISTIKAGRYVSESDICQPIYHAERHIYQRKLSHNSVSALFTPAFNQHLFDVKGETIGFPIHGNVNNHIPFLQRCPLAIDLRGFEMFLQTEFLLPYTHKNKNDPHI